MRDLAFRLWRKRRLVADDLRWRTGLLPRWVREPTSPGCRLLPDGGFLLTRDQRERTALLLRAQRPAAADATVAAANRLVSGEHYVWGRPVPQASSWQDGLLARGWPQTAFWRLELEGPAAPGDVKLAWEPSRHVELLLLGRAYTLTGDVRFATAWANHVETWTAENPPWRGVHWTSPLELAFRVITWSWSSAHFLDAPGLDTPVWERLTAGLSAHLHHIASHLSPRRSTPSNHRVGEAAGLLVGSISLPAHAKADGWYRTGLRTFIESLERGLQDGVIWGENAAAYHFFCLELAVLAWALLRAHRRTVPLALPSLAARLLEGAMVLMPGARSHVRWGDDDGYRLWDPLHQPAERGACAVDAASRLIGVPTPWPGADWHPTVPWVLGPELPSQRGRIRAPGLRVQRTIVRCDSPNTTCYLIGCHARSAALPGHSHADFLSLSFSVAEEPVVLDPGTFTYGGDQGWRTWFRCTGAHSTVLVDGTSQVQPVNRFGWRGGASGKWEHCVDAFGLRLVKGQHDAYARLGVVHHRFVLVTPSGIILLRDVLSGAGTHSLSQRFLLPAGARREEDQATCVAVPTVHGTVRIHATAPPAWDIRTGGEHGWQSPGYGVKEPAALACRDLEVRLPAALAAVIELGETAVLPVEGAILLQGRGRHEVLALRNAQEGRIAAELPHPFGTVRSDAAALHLELSEDGVPTAARMIEGETLELSSGLVLASATRLRAVEVAWDETGARVSSLEPWENLSVAGRPGTLNAVGRARPVGSHFTCDVVSA